MTKQEDRLNGAETATDVAEAATEAAEGEGLAALAQVQALAADFEDRWKRSVAEFINYKRRTEQERSELIRSASGSLLKELLPVLDDLERALESVPAAEAESKWVEGTRLVERKFRAIMERQGVTPIDSLGEPFDPNLHEAVGGSGSHVVQEYQRGYRLHGRTLRPAMVVVGEPSTEV